MRLTKILCEKGEQGYLMKKRVPIPVPMEPPITVPISFPLFNANVLFSNRSRHIKVVEIAVENENEYYICQGFLVLKLFAKVFVRSVTESWILLSIFTEVQKCTKRKASRSAAIFVLPDSCSSQMKLQFAPGIICEINSFEEKFTLISCTFCSSVTVSSLVQLLVFFFQSKALQKYQSVIGTLLTTKESSLIAWQRCCTFSGSKTGTE